MNATATKNDPAIIRAGIAERCNALNLPDEHRIACENAGLDLYWVCGRSNGWCISAGVKMAESMARGRAAGIVPENHFCRHRERCAGLNRCLCDPVCND